MGPTKKRKRKRIHKDDSSLRTIVTQHFREAWSRITLGFVIIAVVGVAVSVITDHFIDFAVKSDSETAESIGRIPSWIYQQLVTKVLTPAVARTVIVEIDPSREFSGMNGEGLCEKRRFLGELLGRIANAGASVIVLDKFFSRGFACINEGSDFEEQIRSLRNAKHPVIVGLAMPEGKNYLDPPLQSDFGDPTQAGIFNVTGDPRRLPLSYEIQGPDDSHRPIDGISLAAAKWDQKDLLETSPLLRSFLDQRAEPFIGFIGEEAWKPEERHFYASEILCGHLASKDAHWRDCLGTIGESLTKLEHKVVVVGEYSKPEDEHRSVVGQVQGFYLHANYIEALLAKQYLRPVGYLDWVVGLSFLLFFKLLLLFRRGPVDTMARIVVSFLGLYFLLLIIVVNAHIYVDPAISVVSTIVEVAAIVGGVSAAALARRFGGAKAIPATE